jgi:hypothetical protein
VALHEGDRMGGAQLYMACVQVKVSKMGGKVCWLRVDAIVTNGT